MIAAAGSAAVLVLGAMEDSQVLTTAGLTVLGTAVVKSVLTAAASWAARFVTPPNTHG